MGLDLTQLNEPQRQVVEHGEGPLLVLAGAGTGKTRALTCRAAYLLERKLASPYSLLIVTFTTRAAWELKERLRLLLDDEVAQNVRAGTFHSLGLRILQTEAESLGYRPDELKVCDARGSKRLLQRAMEEARIRERFWKVDQIQEIIARAKDAQVGPDEFVTVAGDFTQEQVGKVYRIYQRLLKDRNQVDFGDLLMLALKALKGDREVLDFYQDLFTFILVDEFQDTNNAQYELVRLLAAKHRNICAVGSPSQAVYGWRGANIDNILHRFETDFPGTTTVVLDQNYRCSGMILAAAEGVISQLNDRERHLWTQNGPGVPIALITARSERDEATFVAREIRRLIASSMSSQDEGDAPGAQAATRFSDCAVLFRTNAQARLVEQVFLKLNVPYLLVGGLKFFDHSEVRDLLAFLAIVRDPLDDDAFIRIVNTPPRGLGPKSLEQLHSAEFEGAGLLLNMSATLAQKGETIPARVQKAAQEVVELVNDLYAAGQERNVAGLLDYALDRTGYREWLNRDVEAEERWANVRALQDMAVLFEDGAPQGSLSSFLNEMAMLSGNDPLMRTNHEDDRVTLSTMHQAKGLEFPVVFLVGLEEGLFPHALSRTRQELDEERRLCYVGITRARERLYLLYTYARSNGDRVQENPPSRFLYDIPAELMVRGVPPGA
jgi:DNA helicase-2/ATP-dependent DNA helicase PcrA